MEVKSTSYTRYNGDPYWTTARFSSRCGDCEAAINRGEKIFFYPKCKTVYCEKCGKRASREFESVAQDEDMYMSQYEQYGSF